MTMKCVVGKSGSLAVPATLDDARQTPGWRSLNGSSAVQIQVAPFWTATGDCHASEVHIVYDDGSAVRAIYCLDGFPAVTYQGPKTFCAE